MRRDVQFSTWTLEESYVIKMTRAWLQYYHVALGDGIVIPWACHRRLNAYCPMCDTGTGDMGCVWIVKNVL